MDQSNENSAHGLVVAGAKSKRSRVSIQGSKPVRIIFQKDASKQPKNGRNSVISSGILTGFTKANYQLALQNTEKRGNRFYKGEEMGIMTDLQHFKHYGPGVSLFFQFQRSLIKTFLFIALVALVPSVYNVLVGTVSGNSGASSLSYYFLSTTIGNFSSSDSSYTQTSKYLNVISDMVCMFFFIVFYFYWLYRGGVITDQIRTEVKLKSYNVIQLTEFPANATDEDINEFMLQFGVVLEVAPVRNYSETISLSKTIYDLEIELKELELIKEEQKSKEYDHQIKKTQEKIDEVYKQLVLYEDDTKEEIMEYFITFATIEERENALKQLEKYKKKFCDCCVSTPENFLLCGEKVVVKACHNQPGEIIWQNQHITWGTRWIRVVFQYILQLTAMAIGYSLISFLNILVPSSASNVDTSGYTSITIQSVTNTTIAQSWCVSNEVSVLQAGSSSSIYSFCWSYLLAYLFKIGITVGISIVCVIIKFVLKKFVMFLARFKRYKTQSEQSKDMILNLFFVYVTTTVMITFLLQALVFGISFKNFITYFVSSSSYLSTNANNLNQYTDFNADWYLQIGYQITFNCVIMALHPTFTMPFVWWLKEKVRNCFAQKIEVQAKMEKEMEQPEFEVESNYAQTLELVYIALAFGGGMPFVMVICFLALFFRYLYQKHIFFRYCRCPKMFDEALDLQVGSMLPYAVILHFCFAIWMYGVTAIFSFDQSILSNLTTTTSNSILQSIGFILQRVLGTWYFSCFFGLFLLIFLFKQVFFNCVIKTFVSSSNSHKIIPLKIDPSQFESSMNPMVLSTKALCDSYKIENNPDYVEVLEIMKKKRKFLVKVRNVTQE